MFLRTAYVLSIETLFYLNITFLFHSWCLWYDSCIAKPSQYVELHSKCS